MSQATTTSPRTDALDRLLAAVGVPFFLVACTFAYYGQLHRAPSGDTTATVYTSVALAKERTLWLDSYVPLFNERFGEYTFMLTTGRDGHVVNRSPFASSIVALPVVGSFALAGVDEDDWDAWMEAGMLTASLLAAASVAVLFVLLTRLTTREHAALIAGVYAFGTMTWTIAGQALWQHGGAVLALTIALLGLVDRRLVLAGAAVGAMIAFRFSTPVIAVCLLPLIGRAGRDWLRFTLGAAPFLGGLAALNWAAFGSPLEQGYGADHVKRAIGAPLAAALLVGASLVVLHKSLPRRAFLGAVVALALVGIGVAAVVARSRLAVVGEGAAGLVASPGHGLLVYSPVLAFAVVGAVRAWRTPLYRWCAVAAVAYVAVTANSSQWYGGESFGPRRLAETVPLLAVLLVPAFDAVSGTRWRRVFWAALGWSVLVQLVAAATWPPGSWYDEHDLRNGWTWWNPLDNELTASLFDEPSLAANLAAMTGIAVGGIALGLLVGDVVARRRHG